MNADSSHASVRADVTAIVLTRDEEDNLPDCLRSLADWVEQVYVVDSGSTDGTVEVAERFGATVVEHPFDNYGAQRNWALSSLPIRTGWVLNVDADERVTPELRASIVGALAATTPETAGFLMARRTMFLGRWIRHGGHYPVWHLRLFRNGRGRCEDRLYDQHFVADGPVAQLPGDLIDTLTSDISTFCRRHLRWAELEAQEHEASGGEGRIRGKLGSGNAIEGRRWARERYQGLPLFIRPVLYFAYRYFLRAGFLDGKEGLVFHFLQGFWFRFLVDSLIFERKLAQLRQPSLGRSPAEPDSRGRSSTPLPRRVDL